jgi:hypothetical protein
MHITYKQIAATQLKNQSNIFCYKQVAATRLGNQSSMSWLQTGRRYTAQNLIDAAKEHCRCGLFAADKSKNMF